MENIIEEEKKMTRWMVRARYSYDNANPQFRRNNGHLGNGQWIYAKGKVFGDAKYGSIYVQYSTAQGALTRIWNWAQSSGYILPIDVNTISIINVKVSIPTDEQIKENYYGSYL